MTSRIIPQNSVYDVATFTLLSDGKDITNRYAVLSLSVNREVNRIPSARIILRDGSAADETFAASDSDDLIPGKELEIALGYDGNDQTVFRGVVIKHGLKLAPNGDSMLTVDCKDRAVGLTISRRSRHFKDVKDSEAIATIIKDHSGISPKLEATRVKHQEIVQYYSTDWDFILSRAEMNGQVVLVKDGIIQVQTPTTSGSPLITLTYGANILEIETEMDARYQYQAVNAKSWSCADQTLLEVNGKEPTVNSQGNLSGKKLAQVTRVKELELRHGGFVNIQELQEWADAQMLKSRLSKIQGRIKTKGYRAAKPDALIELAGMGSRFNGLAYVSGVRHELVGGAWQTHLQVGLNPQWFYREEGIVESPASGLLPGVSGLQIGVAVQLQDDPTKEFRVLVKSPIINDKADTSIWARVATLDAGNNRGTFFRPEIGDEVLLGFINDDPRHPVILGMLNSSKNPAPLQPIDPNHEKGFITRSGMKVLFDDENKVMTLETPGGNKVVISDKEKGITLTDQHTNTVTLDDKGISLKSPKDIVLEATGKLTLKAVQDASLEGMNVKVNAQSQFKAQGNAGAEVSTSAIAVLKGSLVQIN
ncbi:type VI secretion system tip protein VgrG [Trichocoleus sp. FACHB-591]|uniref:type VI secretion system tip protein VgrG n=1 Tax=Trichocoleus sp. FACHB-591 TaxID=2692872 RepID=UPI001688D295|nr:type VI secretion system tip protein VgrG [Trichocoleus sp. FACHB-591]MBD2095625.1 type VI secretion system tip protein VgrG [Trichocoleus sp. FACHB-591]